MFAEVANLRTAHTLSWTLNPKTWMREAGRNPGCLLIGCLRHACQGPGTFSFLFPSRQKQQLPFLFNPKHHKKVIQNG
jgi:hypothetical protein